MAKAKSKNDVIESAEDKKSKKKSGKILGDPITTLSEN